MSKTCYKLTKKFNKSVGTFKKSEPKLGLDDPKTLLMISLIKEEYLELMGAVVSEDVKEIIDACGDIQVAINNLLLCLGVDGDELNKEIFRSNMTKIINDIPTLKSNKKLLALCNKRFEVHAVEDGYVLRNPLNGKIIKPLTYEPPQLGRFL